MHKFKEVRPIELNTIYNEDCLEGMKKIPDKSVDMILCDLPYGTTACKWDTIIPFEPLWEQYERIIKSKGNIVLTSSQPFTSKLIASNLDMFRHEWIWEKDNGTNFLSAKKIPFKVHENVVVFGYKANNKGMFPLSRGYMMSEKEKSGLSTKDFKKILGNDMASHYFTNGEQFCIPTKKNYLKLQQGTGLFSRPWEKLKEIYDEENKSHTYNPQMTKGNPYISGTGANVGVYGETKKVVTENKTGDRYPRSVIKFNSEKGLHPTQKPVPLFEYLIKTYTNEGGTVLDNCMGSGTTAIACMNTNRNFIGFELDETYYNLSLQRIAEVKKCN